jgi:type IV pilus assembly protein PilQ
MKRLEKIGSLLAHPANAVASTFVFLLAFAPMSAFAVTKISRIEFFGKNSPNQMVVVGDGPIEFEEIRNPADKQVIFEIKNARLANPNAGRRLDTASFNSKVSLISPYNVEGKNSVRVIVQMRGDASVSTLAEGSRLYVGFDGMADPNILPAATVNGTATAAGAFDAPSSDRPAMTAGGVRVSQSSGEAPAATPEGRIDQFLDASMTKSYFGRHITLQVKEADLVDVFKLIGETSGFNMVIGSDVTGKVTLSLVDVPWDLALDTVLTTNKLGAERTGNVLRVALLATLTAEKLAQQQAKIAADNSAPRITRIFPLSYASGASLLPILTRFGAGQAGVTVGMANRDTIVVDERTNSLVIQDTSDNLERMAKIIRLLDRQTPQVQIEAKIIEATENFTKTIGGSFAATAPTNWGGAGSSFMGGQTISAPSLPGAGAAGQNPPSAALGMALKIGAIANTRLTALLNLTESEGLNKVLASPRTVVLNKQTSTIVQGVPVLVPVTVQNPLNGTSIISTEVRNANLSLNVTPTVTNDGNILMNLGVTNDSSYSLSDTQTGIATRNINTQVVAESGSTIAIGGVYRQTEEEGKSGIPGLRNLPLIGALFGSETKSNVRSELFIFVTPRILNEGVMGAEIETSQSSAVRRSSASY